MRYAAIPLEVLIPKANVMKILYPTDILFRFCLFVSVILCGCSQEETFEEESTILTRSLKESPYIVDERCARSVATYFYSQLIESTGGVRQAESREVLPVFSDSGHLVMFAVNMIPEGYVLVSAVKTTVPVLSFCTVGSFGNFKFRDLTLQNLISAQDKLINLSEDDLQRRFMGFKHEWNLFPRDDKLMKTSVEQCSDYGNPIIAATFCDWDRQGWIFYDAQYWLQEKIHMPFLEGLETALAKYDRPVEWCDGVLQNKRSYIVLKTDSYITKTNSIPFSSAWDTGAPYNDCVPQSYPLSSQGVAVAQVLNHFGDNLITGYTRGAENKLKDIDEIAAFVYDVCTQLHTHFTPSWSQSTMSEMQGFFNAHSYAYDFSQSESFGSSLFMSSIDAGLPLIMEETDKDGNREACLLIGYVNRNVSRWYSLMVPNPATDDLMPFFEGQRWGDTGNATLYMTDNKGFSLKLPTREDAGGSSDWTPLREFITHLRKILK